MDEIELRPRKRRLVLAALVLATSLVPILSDASVACAFLNPQTMMGFEVPGPTAMCRGEVATHIGTPGADSIVGTPGRDVIVGRGGNDVIRAKGGNDLICAGPGRDRVSGGAGRDRIFGQGGNDILRGGSGNDLLNGGPGRDICRGGPGRDRAVNCEETRGIP
ncbi:MAG TPA: calcium-binding protein [Actinomycetota bacterium]|nr:calcium-binding protein [Actinomycetota bacterium]